MPILVPTYSTNIFTSRTSTSRIHLILYVVPFVHRYVTCARFGCWYLCRRFLTTDAIGRIIVGGWDRKDTSGLRERDW